MTRWETLLIIPLISASHETPNLLEYLLLLNISFKDNVSLDTKIKALGGKYERIINIVQENSVAWEDSHLERVAIKTLFGESAEKIGEAILSERNHQG